MKFRTTIELGGKTATGMRVPKEVVAALASGQRPPVRVTINGYTYRSTIAAYTGDYFLPVSAEVRGHSGVQAGDEVEVEVELDTEPREVEVPQDLVFALAAEPAARSLFETLSYSNRRRIVLNINDAKTPETRQRRIAKAVESLREGRV